MSKYGVLTGDLHSGRKAFLTILHFLIFGAVRADAMTEHDLGMFGNVLFQLTPAVLILFNLFSVHADGNDPFQLFDPCQRLLKFFFLLCKLIPLFLHKIVSSL